MPYYPSLSEVREAHLKAKLTGIPIGELFCVNCKDYFWDIGKPLFYENSFICELCFLGILQNDDF